jgi:hypothetical protein
VSANQELAMEKDQNTYSWSVSGGKINCCTSKDSTCTVSNLWEVTELTAFHDAELQQATKETNGILEDLKKTNKDPKRDLSFIQIKDRHFLVWTYPGLVGPDDDETTTRKMLRLKAR